MQTLTTYEYETFIIKLRSVDSPEIKEKIGN